MIDEKMMKIHLQIDCQQYPLNIRREDEQLYRDAAKLINNKLNKYRSHMPDMDSNKHWAMAAFEIAFENMMHLIFLFSCVCVCVGEGKCLFTDSNL